MIQQIGIGLNQDAVEEWIEYRQFKKKPLSQFALDKTIKLLSKYSPDHQQYLIDTAIQNDWIGIHHVDPPKAATSTRERSLEADLTDTSWATL